eukprot:1177639-Prorocentrum_minimum.AAC.1
MSSPTRRRGNYLLGVLGWECFGAEGAGEATRAYNGERGTLAGEAGGPTLPAPLWEGRARRGARQAVGVPRRSTPLLGCRCAEFCRERCATGVAGQVGGRLAVR